MFSGFFLLCLFCALFARSSLWGEREGGGNFDPFEMMYNSHRGWWFIKVKCGGKWNVVGYYRLGVHRVLPTDGILPLAWPGPHWNTTNHTQKGKTIVWGEISGFGFSRSRQTFFFYILLLLSLGFWCLCLWLDLYYCLWGVKPCLPELSGPARPLDIGQSPAIVLKC